MFGRESEVAARSDAIRASRDGAPSARDDPEREPLRRRPVAGGVGRDQHRAVAPDGQLLAPDAAREPVPGGAGGRGDREAPGAAPANAAGRLAVGARGLHATAADLAPGYAALDRHDHARRLG